MNKTELRRHMRRQRRALNRRQREQAAWHLLRSLRQSAHFQYSRHIAVYLTNDGEIDTSVFIRDLQRRGKTLYLPVLHPLRKGHLSFLPFNRQSRMVKNRFGISEPDFAGHRAMPARFIHLICMPLVAFDKDGNRLGMGGGFYDRTLAFSRSEGNKPRLIGCAYELQKVEALPAEAWDIPLTAIATNAGLHRFRQS
jgi:5-formyltetrahydrofolate cyclo-ligase